MLKNIFFLIYSSLFFTVSCAQETVKTKLVIRADDMGFCSAVNQACIKGYKEGIITDVEVLVPGAWFLDAANLLNENPGLDVGIHLALTSEWDNVKWGPISNAKGLINIDGYFPSSTEEMLALKASKEAIKRELSAQIELGLKYIPHVSHLSTHMFYQNIDTVITQVINELSVQYNLPIVIPNVASIGSFWAIDADKKEDELASFLNNLKEGNHAFVLHPIVANQESKAIRGSGMDPNVNMVKHRQKVLDATCSPRIKSIIEEKGIELVSFKSLLSE